MGRVVAVPEEIEQLFIGDYSGVEIELKRLGVVAEFVIGGVLLAAPGIAYTRPYYSWKTPEPGVRAPESAKREGGRLQMRRRHGIDEWDAI
jgi:hypothetical protein